MLKAILVDCIPPQTTKEEAEYRLSEAESLIKTYGGIVVVKKIQKRQTPDYKTFIGSGKLEEIIKEISNDSPNENAEEIQKSSQDKTSAANILIINNELKPHQTYNINERLRKFYAEEKRKYHDPKIKGKITKEAKEPIQAWDRIDLILKIFQKHASTREARLEIELASIKHMGPRIFGMGMQLSRQGGGIGTRGSGETNIEAMKRHLNKMEDSIRKELEAYKKVRKIHRNARKRNNFKTVGIIGYTNAGKSTLLNALTRKGAYAADKLFATLDTRVGKMFLHENNKKAGQENSEKKALPADVLPTDEEKNHFQKPHEVLISDTIGFIENLPTTLIKSFQSTLEESIEADILLHVIDINDPRFLQKIEVVNEILFQIDALMKPTIYVFNKIDRLSDLDRRLFEDQDETPQLSPISLQTSTQNYVNRRQLTKQFKIFHPCFVSAETKEGLKELKQTISDTLFPEPQSTNPTGILNVIKNLKQERHTKNFIQKIQEKSQDEA